MLRNITLSNKKILLIFISFILVLQSCSSIRLISEYDEITDKTVTELQEKVSGYFVTLERTIGTNEAQYDNFVQNFDEIKIDLNTLEVRAAAFDKNSIVQKQVAELKKMIKNLESLHKLEFKTYDQIKPLRQPFNTAFTSIIKLQLALKRGEKTKG